MNNSFLNLVKIQFKEFVREPELLFWAIIFPIILSGVLGLAFSSDAAQESKVAVIENAYTENNVQMSRFLNLEADSTGRIIFDFIRMPDSTAFLKLKRGEVSLILQPLNTQNISYHFDPQNETSNLHFLYLERILHDNNDQTLIRPVTTQGSRYIDFLIPGMIAFGIMNSCVWGIGWNLIELRMKKLLRRMVATPMRKTEFLLAHFVTRLILSFIEALILLIFAYYIFDLRIMGSIGALLFVFVAANVAFGGIAVLAGSRASKTQVGSGLINFITLSMTVLSGVFFSYYNFPESIAGIIKYLPLTLLADALRSIFNEGSGLAEVSSMISLLFVYGIVCFFAGMKIFKWH